MTLHTHVSKTLYSDDFDFDILSSALHPLPKACMVKKTLGHGEKLSRTASEFLVVRILKNTKFTNNSALHLLSRSVCIYGKIKSQAKLLSAKSIFS